MDEIRVECFCMCRSILYLQLFISFIFSEPFNGLTLISKETAGPGSPALTQLIDNDGPCNSVIYLDAVMSMTDTSNTGSYEFIYTLSDINGTLNTINSNLSNKDKFFFIHVYKPHPPFIFDSNCF